MRLAITRPAEDAARLARRLEGFGHRCIIAPLMEIHPVALDIDHLDLARIQAVAFTSSNGVKMLVGQPRLDVLHKLPAFAVGESTAKAARDGGFSEIMVADGNVDSLSKKICQALSAEQGVVLHAGGQDVAGDLVGQLRGAGFDAIKLTLYRANAMKVLPECLAKAIEENELEGVLLLSPRTAYIYVELLKKHNICLASGVIRHYCLSESVAHKLLASGVATGDIEIAAEPRLDALLSLVNQAN